MKTLCVYYSRTGVTEAVAWRLASQWNADLMEITDGKNYKGVLGYIKAAVQGLRQHLPALLPYQPPRPLEEYDAVLLVAPVWCERICPVARAFLLNNRDALQNKVYFVITHMSDLTYEDNILLAQIAMGKQNPHLSLQTHRHDWKADVDAFSASR